MKTHWSQWTKEKRLPLFSGALVIWLTISVNVGVCLAVGPTAITIALWPFSLQLDWNDWYWTRWTRKKLQQKS